MPGKGPQYLVFRRRWANGEEYRSSSGFLANSKAAIQLSKLEEIFGDLAIEEIASTSGKVALKSLIKNTRTGPVLNMSKLLKLVPKGFANPTLELVVLPSVPNNSIVDKKTRLNYCVHVSFLANMLWGFDSFDDIKRSEVLRMNSIFSSCILTVNDKKHPKVLILINDRDVAISFGHYSELAGLDDIRTHVLSIPIYSILEKFVRPEQKKLIITGSFTGGVAAQLLTLQILESEQDPEFNLNCVTFDTPSYMSSDVYSSFGAHNECFINVIQEEHIPRLSVISALEYAENIDDELNLSTDMRDALNLYNNAKNQGSRSYEIPNDIAAKFYALLADSSVCFVGDIILLNKNGKPKMYPHDEYTIFGYKDALGGRNVLEVVNSNIQLIMDGKQGMNELSNNVMGFLRSNGFSDSAMKEIPKHELTIEPRVNPQLPFCVFTEIPVPGGMYAYRFKVTGENLDCVIKPKDDEYEYTLGENNTAVPFNLNFNNGKKVTCYVESMMPTEVMVRTSPTSRFVSHTIAGTLNTSLGQYNANFIGEKTDSTSLSPSEMAQLGLNEEAILRMIGILMLDLQEEKRTNTKVMSRKYQCALENLKRIELISKGMEAKGTDSILVNTIQSEMKNEMPNIAHVISVARPIVNTFIEEMSKPLLITEKTGVEKFGLAFKAKLSLITGGFLKKLGKRNSSLAYKGELMSEYAKRSMKFAEANIRYTSILKLLAFILIDGVPQNAVGLADLESLVVKKYDENANDHTLTYGNISLPLDGLRKRIIIKLNTMERQEDKNFEELGIIKALTTNPYKDTLKDLTRRLIAAGQMCSLRESFSHAVCISFVGTHNAGKSTMMHSLFNIDTDPSFFERTLQVNSFRPPVYTTIAGDKKLSSLPIHNPLLHSDLRFLDFPGATDERESIKAQTSLLLGLSSLVVVVFNAVHIAQPECEIMKLVKSKGMPYLVLLNQKDKVISNLKLEDNKYSQDANKTDVNTNVNTSDDGTNNKNNEDEFIRTSLDTLVKNSATRLGIDIHDIMLTSSFDTVPIKTELLGRLRRLTNLRKCYLSLLLAGDIYKILIKQSKSFVENVYNQIDSQDDSFLFSDNTIQNMLRKVKAEQLKSPKANWRDFVFENEVTLLEKIMRRKNLEDKDILEQLLKAYEDTSTPLPSNNLQIFGITDASSIPPFKWEDIESITEFPGGIFAKYKGKQVTEDALAAKNWLTKKISDKRGEQKIILHVQSTDQNVFANELLKLDISDFRKCIVCKDETEALDCGGVIASYINGLCNELAKLAGDHNFEPLQSTNNNAIYFSPDYSAYPPEEKKKFDRYVHILYKLIMLIISQLGIEKTFVMSCNLSTTIFKILLGYPMTVKDVQETSQEMYNALKAIADASRECNVEDLFLSTTCPSPSDIYSQQLLWPNNEKDEELNNDNVEKYLIACMKYLLWVDYDFGPILREFDELISIKELQQHFTPDTLKLVCCGTQKIDKEDIISNSDYVRFDDNAIGMTRKDWLKRFIRELDDNQCSLFIGFYTGILSPPLGGFGKLNPKMSFFLDEGANPNSLPRGSTCFNRMTIPIYQTYDIMKDKILLAITNTSNTEFGQK